MIRKEDDVGGPVRVTRAEERVYNNTEEIRPTSLVNPTSENDLSASMGKATGLRECDNTNNYQGANLQNILRFVVRLS